MNANDIYTACCLVYAFIGVMSIIWLDFWNYRVAFRDATYFKVSRINRTYFSIGRKFSAMFSTLLIYLVVDSIHDYFFEGKSARNVKVLVFSIAIFVLWNCLMLFIQKKKMGALPLKKSGDVREMIKSIESEPFHKEADCVWTSRSWVRLGHQFYPWKELKEITTSRATHKGNVFPIIITRDGKKHDNTGFTLSITKIGAHKYVSQDVFDAFERINNKLKAFEEN